MSWEYLATEKFNERYEIVARYLRNAIDLSDKVILDLNCGQAGFRKFIECKEYFANDVFLPDNTAGIEFLQIPDDQVDIKSDIIVLFGYGGGEHTGEPLESKTAGESLVRLSKKYKPEFIVIEMAEKWEDDYKIMSGLKKKLDDYEIVFETRIEIKPVKHYHNNRLICILKLCGHFKKN